MNNMDGPNKHIKLRLSEQLPKHAADPGMWERMSAKLDALDAEAAYQQKLQELPVHAPDEGTWAIISRRLSRTVYLKTSIRIALSAAAGLLLFFTVSKFAGLTTENAVQPGVQQQEISAIKPGGAEKANTSGSGQISAANKNTLASAQISKQKSIVTQGTQKTAKTGGGKPAGTTVANAATLKDHQAIMASLPTEPNTMALPDMAPALAVQTAVETQNASKTSDETGLTPEQITALSNPLVTPFNYNGNSVKESSKTPQLTDTELSSMPTTTAKTSNPNHFALAMGYLPENINNGTDNSVFYNVDLTAMYNKEKVRFNTSIGMAYNQEELEISMNYDVKSPVTAMGPGGKIDTISYNTASLESEYVGSEKHQYFTYNLGLGRRLFSKGKFSTWINAGAGFGVRLNNPDLVSTTENSIKNQYNASITSVSSSKPVYNDVNVNFVTGIDFNYEVLNRLSIYFTPTSRWYFKPVLSINNQPTDELTLGFKTGIKFDF